MAIFSDFSDLETRFFRYHSLAPMYYRGAQAAIVVYDITNAGERTIEIKDVEMVQSIGTENIILFGYVSLGFKLMMGCGNHVGTAVELKQPLSNSWGFN